ncbi:MAG: hypothetical protein HXK31_04295, partial [Atopobium sp.]|nr:hypothetical protein [Atopobium sp.]
TTATAAAEKVETVAAKAERAAEEVSHVATDAKNANTAAKEAKTMATKAQSDASEAKSTVANLTNTFSHDADGAHVGSKAGIHTTIDAQGMKLKDGTSEFASFTKNSVKLSGGDLLINSGFISDFGFNSTAISSNVIDLESKKMLFSYAPRHFFRTIESRDGRFVSTDVEITPDKIAIGSPTRSNSIYSDNLAKVIEFRPWTDLVNNSSVRVRYCVRGGVMYLDCFLTGGYPTYTTTAQIPSDLLPSNAGYYPLATQKGNNTAKIWLGAAGGGDGHVYFYNYDSGYCSGVIPIIPKSLE